MNKEDYKSQLEALLKSLPKKDREEAILFYMEMIDDRIDEGMSEEDAIANVASPGVAAEEIIASNNSAKQALISFEISTENEADDVEVSDEADESLLHKIKTRNLSTKEWIVLLVTCPFWLPLLVGIAGLGVGLALVLAAAYICVWVLIACVWILALGFLVNVPALLIFSAWGIQTANPAYTISNIGCAMLFFGCGAWLCKGAIYLTKKFLNWTKQNVYVRFGKKNAVEEDMATQSQGNTCANEGNEKKYVATDLPTNKFACFKKQFLRVCLILIFAGVILALLGFVVSGFDHNYMNIYFGEDGYYLGGARIEKPEELFITPFILFG